MIYRKEDHGYFDHGWLKTYHHFSFADYYNPDRMHFGPLRVVNDDVIDPHQGFPKHPHRDMEIISYVVDGHLSHGDSMGHEETIQRGQVQYMSAGKGVMHSEYNHGDQATRLLQIWILPDQKSYEPQYGDHRYPWEDRVNQWLKIVGQGSGVVVHQDVNFYVTFLEEDHALDMTIEEHRQAYLVNIEGQTMINDELLEAGDAMEVYEDIRIKGSGSHVLVIEMARG